MTKYFFVLILLLSCNSKKKILYEDSSDKFYVTVEKSEKNGVVDSLYTFYSFDNPTEIKEVGFYKDGFRNDFWNYNLPTEVKTIKWAYYKDKYLNFETNLFSYADSIKHGDFFTKFLFTEDTNKIGLTVSINGPFKDSVPDINYERITKNEFILLGVTPIYFNTKKLHGNIFINDVAVRKLDNQIRYIKGAFGFIDEKHFIEFSVSSTTRNNFFADNLFNSVLTNFSIDGKWFYNPFSSSNLKE